MIKGYKELIQQEQDLINMLDSIPWDSIKKFINSKKTLRNKCTFGGFRIQKSNKQHIYKVLNDNLQMDHVISLFLDWYNYHNEYKNLLDPYFQSNEYKKWVKDKELDNGRYALPNDIFSQLCDIFENNNHISIFLYFSPIVFDENQQKEMKKLINAGSDTSDKLSRNEKKSDVAVNKKNYKENKELKKLQELNKKQLSEIEKLQKEKQKLLNSKHTLRIEFKKIDNKWEDKINDLKKEYEEKIEKQNINLEKVNYEQNERNKELKKFRKDYLKIKNEFNTFMTNYNKLKNESEQKIVNIINRINIDELIIALNESQPVKDSLHKHVKIPKSNYEENFDENYIYTFWTKQLEYEEKIIRELFDIELTSIIDGSYSEKWFDQSDKFTDLKYSLQARSVLINLYYEILRQQID